MQHLTLTLSQNNLNAVHACCRFGDTYYFVSHKK